MKHKNFKDKINKKELYKKNNKERIECKCKMWK